MKKIASLLLLAILFLVPINMALAYDEEITFQGIPWGTNGEETLHILQNEKGIVDFPNLVRKLTLGSTIAVAEGFVPFVWPEDDSDIYQAESYRYQDFPFKDSVSAVLVDGQSIKKTVGGFEPWGIKLSYINRGNDMFELSSVEISYNTDDKKDIANQIYNELKDKLSSIYGDSQEYNVNEEYNGAEFCVWHGLNNTGIALVSSYISHSGGFYSVTLVYGKTDDIINLASISTSVSQSSQPNSTKDDSGL